MKYVMLNIDGMPSPILFPEYVQHADIAKALRSILPNARVESAGFVDSDYAAFIVRETGSESLNLGPGAQDAQTIGLHLEPPHVPEHAAPSPISA
jgi:hypothetical protein